MQCKCIHFITEFFLTYNNFLSSTVNFCRNLSYYDAVHGTYIIEIQSFAHIGSIVGVQNISEGSNLTLQVRIVYKMPHTAKNTL